MPTKTRVIKSILKKSAARRAKSQKIKCPKSALYILTPANPGLRLTCGRVSITIPSGPSIGEKWTPNTWKAFYKVRDHYHPFDRFASMVRLGSNEAVLLKKIARYVG